MFPFICMGWNDDHHGRVFGQLWLFFIFKYNLSSTPYVMWTVCVEHVLVNLVNALDLSWATVRHIVWWDRRHCNFTVSLCKCQEIQAKFWDSKSYCKSEQKCKNIMQKWRCESEWFFLPRSGSIMFFELSKWSLTFCISLFERADVKLNTWWTKWSRSLSTWRWNPCIRAFSWGCSSNQNIWKHSKKYSSFVAKQISSFSYQNNFQILFTLQYKSCCIRIHAKLFSKTCLDYKTCHTNYSKTRLEYRTQQPSVDITMTMT